MKNSSYDKRLIELSLAEHLFNAEQYENALGINLRIGAELNDLRDYDSALQFMERAETCSRKTQNKKKLAESLHQKGLALQYLSRFPEALCAFNQSLEIKREIGDRVGEAQILHQIGMVCEETNRFQEALQNYNQSLEIKREIGDRVGETQTLHQIDMVCEETNRFQEALQNCNQGLEIKNQLTNCFEELTSFQGDPVGWLKKAIVAPEKKMVFFVGAGISVGSGLPNFFKFSSDFIGSICPSNLKKRDIDEICQRLRPEVLLQIVQQIHKDHALDFYSSLESKLPNANHFFLALALKAGHCIFTTNVDTLIEQACKELEIPCNPIVHENEYDHFLEEQSKSDSGMDFKSQLFKLHGSIESDKVGLKKYESIRFILDRVGLGLTESQEKIFSACLQDYDFIFLGYSGNDHFSVLPILLKVDSDQKIYWFKFEPDKTKLDFNRGIGYFRNRKEDLLNTALEGTTPKVKWEEISILEVLSKREESILVRGDSSHIVKQSLEQFIQLSDDPEIQKFNAYLQTLHGRQGTKKESIEPAWVKTVTGFERHLLAAMLLIRMRDLSDRTENQLNQAENYANDGREQAEVDRLRISTFSITRRLGNIKSGRENLHMAINRFKELGDFISEVEAHLELANLMRIDRDFESAKETLDKAESLLIENRSNFQGQNRSYDWPRLMAQLFHHRGLIYGLGQKGTIVDKLKGINYCDEAYNFAYQAGDVSRRAAALNARGLIIYQLAERSGGLLREAESSLDNAFALYTRIGDPRASFQPLRNRLLIQRLRILGSKLHARNYWLNEAQKDCGRARNYLNLMRISRGEPGADMIEVDYRQAQLFGLNGNNDEARRLFQEVLAYWKGKKDLHQQARVWRDLLSLTDDWDKDQECIQPLLALIESLLHSEKECRRYKNDLLRLENIRDMLIDAYLKAYEHKDQEYLRKIVALMEQGGKIAEKFGEENLSQEFKIWSSGNRE